MNIPFDNNSGEKYSIVVSVDDIESGDGIVISLNRKACESFAKLFLQMATTEDGTHVHLGYDESEPQGPGVRLELRENT